MLKWILAPLLGCVIGYITNDLAIRMLFHPRKPVYIGKFHVPFTPGLIPQQKDRIAASIGRVVSSQFLNASTLEQTFLSEEIMTAINDKLDRMLEGLASDEHTLREKLSEYVNDEKLEYYRDYVQKHGAETITEKLISADVGGTIVVTAVASMKEKKRFALISGLLDEENLRTELGGKLNNMIASKGPEILEKEIGNMEEALLEEQVCTLYAKYEDKAITLKGGLLELYRSVIERNLENVLTLVNIEQVVVDRISALSAEELEELIFSVMKKELKAIVYLGAALGFVMGFVNLLF